MDSASNSQQKRELAAHALPMGLFLGLLALASGLKKIGGAFWPFWLAAPEFWIYPAQTVLCGAMLFCFRREYDFHRLVRIPFTAAIAVLVFLLWIAPQAFLGFAPRTDGFNPETFAAAPAAYWATIILRFLRLVIVVPLVEEIFWRGFLLRYCIDERFSTVPFGKFSWLSFGIVTLAFGFSHSSADWAAAFITGAIYNGIAYRTKSLASCIFAHALTNLLLGAWIMQTGQWGFW